MGFATLEQVAIIHKATRVSAMLADLKAARKFGGGLLVVGETRIELYHTTTVRGKRAKMGAFWFHTSYVAGNELRLGATDLDKICKDKKHRVFDEGFQVVVEFAPLGE